MNQKLTFFTFILLAFFINSCAGKKASKAGVTYSDITVESFMAQQSDKGSYQLIDVRTPGEIALGKIAPEALEIDYKESDFTEKITQLDKSKNYIVYCRSGGRSASASQIMIDHGFTQVANLLGGYDEYSSK